MVGRGLGLWASRLFVGVLLLTPALVTAPAQAAKTRNAAILARALSFELTLDERVGPTVTVAVLFKRSDRKSETNADEWMDAFRGLSGVRVKDRPLSAIKIGYSAAEVVKVIEREGVDVLLVADGLGADLEAIATIARARHVLTASNGVADVARSLTLCVTEEGDKVKIVINLNAANLEGIRFSSNLLKLATLIR